MRPEAPMFSPVQKAHAWSNSDDFALTSNGGRSSVQSPVNDLTTQDLGGSPLEMILHESMKTLLSEVSELKARCDSLESANSELKIEMKAAKDTCQASASHTQASIVNGNLTGYDSDSSTDEGTSSKIPSDEVEDLSKRVDEEIENIAKVLGDFNGRIFKEQAARQALEKRVDQDSRSATGVKGRVGALEAKHRKLDDNVHDLQTTAPANGNSAYGSTATPSTNDLSSYFSDSIEKVQEDVEEMREKLHGIDDGIKAHGKILQALLKDNSQDGGFSGPANGGSTLIVDLKQELEGTKAELKTIKKERKMEQKIDDAFTRDELHKMFHQLTSIIVSDDCEIREAGPFKAEFNLAIRLRDRVVYRLALLNFHDEAFNEAKNAKVYD